MGRRALTVPLLVVLGLLAAGGLTWGWVKALDDAADLERRAEEAVLFKRGDDPYADPDMTYPPSAPPVFAVLVPTSGPALRRGLWLGLNLAALAAACGAVVASWGRPWPPWARAAFCLASAATKPARGGTALGQFHLIPVALVLWAEAATRAGRQVVAGLLVGLALIKPTMTAPYLVLLAVRRRWTSVATALGVQAALLAITSTWLGIGPVTLVREWLDLAKDQLNAGTIDLPTLMQWIWPGGSVGLATSLAALAMIAAMLFAWRDRSDLGLTSLALFGAAVMTYHRQYDMTLMIPALAYFLDAGLRQGRRIGFVVAAMLAALLIPPSPPERWPALVRAYQATFAAGSYVALAALVAMVATEEGRPRPS